jgi:hypothetical protein
MSASGGAQPVPSDASPASSTVRVAAVVPGVPARAQPSAAPYKPFTRARRVASAIVGCFLMAFCGAQFSLGAWSDQFARAVNLPFTGIELMSSLLNAGTYGGALVCALLYRVLPPRVAPALLCLAAALMYVINNTLIWACAAGHLIIPTAAIPAFFFFLGLGSGALLTVALAVNVPLFPQDRGKIVGLLSGSMSLGGVIYAALFHAFDTVADFLAAFLASSVTIAVAGILTQRIQPPPPPPAASSGGAAGVAKPAVLDIYGLALFSDARFYVAWTAFLIECGAALMLGNNIQQMLLSASETTLPSIMVTVYNVCSIVGRIGIGVVSDALYVVVFVAEPRGRGLAHTRSRSRFLQRQPCTAGHVGVHRAHRHVPRCVRARTTQRAGGLRCCARVCCSADHSGIRAGHHLRIEPYCWPVLWWYAVEAETQ